MRCVDLAKLHRSAGVVFDCLFEILFEVSVIEEDVRVVEPTVEMTLDAFDRLNHTVQLFISCKDNEGGIGPGLPCGLFRVEAACGKDSVIFFADFPGRVVSTRGLQVFCEHTEWREEFPLEPVYVQWSWGV